MGHEAAGHVVELGEGVSDFKVGDAVGFLPALDCCFEVGYSHSLSSLNERKTARYLLWDNTCTDTR